MNPRNLFTLTSCQQQMYQVQPDNFPGYNWHDNPDEYEVPPYITQSPLRFWYNTQDSDFSTHWHNAYELIIPLENEFTATVQNATYQLEPGDILLIPPGELHSLKAPPTGTRFIFLFELSLLGQLVDFSQTRYALNKSILITSTTCPAIYEKEISLVMLLAAYYWGDSPTKQMHIYGCLMEFYACFTDYRTQSEPSSTKKNATATHKQNIRKVNSILQYMQQHYSEKITLETAAERINLSKFYFTRIFKQYTGQTFYDYLNVLRIKASEDLLKNTSTPISYIASACGYYSISSFNRSFHKIKGCTPSEFRSLYGHGI